jgi:hypothetical protein
MKILARYALAQCYILNGNFDGAIQLLEEETRGNISALSYDYPRFYLDQDDGNKLPPLSDDYLELQISKESDYYPPFRDHAISDDCQYFIGMIYKERLGEKNIETQEAFAKVKRFYPTSDKARKAESNL